MIHVLLALSFFVIWQRAVALAFEMLTFFSDCIVNLRVVVDEKSVCGLHGVLRKLTRFIVVIPADFCRSVSFFKFLFKIIIVAE